jgi:hypothetical protein
MPFAIGQAMFAKLGDGAAVACGAEDVVEWATLRDVVIDIVGRDEREVGFASEVLELLQAMAIERPAMEGGEGITAVIESVP